MCGIAALLRMAPGPPLDGVIRGMTSCLKHRGPDAAGTWEDTDAGVVLGHRRLSIVELSPLGAQPMMSSSGRFVLSFNGEFYNFRAVRASLMAAGASFRGGSDTEVALAALEAWGIEGALRRLAGMFALAIWDRASAELILARDRVGEKPLYYGLVGDCLAAASELKALMAVPGWAGEIDRDVLPLYLRGNYVPAPYSIFRGIAKLPPGTFLRVGRADLAAGHLPEPTTYWSLASVASRGMEDPFVGSVAEAADTLEACLGDVIGEQMLADVPLGALLSGGIDSSLVTALMQARSDRPVRTFTISFDDPAFDEAAHASAVARHLGTEHHELVMRAEDLLALVPIMGQIYDEPFADSSQVPTAMVSRLARGQVTVCLTGDGGDEMFCGYNRHVKLASISARADRLPGPARRAASRLLLSVPTSWYDAVLRRSGHRILGEQVQKLAALLLEDDIDGRYLRLASHWDPQLAPVIGAQARMSLLDERHRWAELPDPLARLLWIESATSLPDDMLVKVDRAAMSVGLEARTPFVDHRVVELAWRMPMSMKIRNGTGKWLLREVLARYIPRPLFDRPKAGFGVPIDVWLRGPLRDWAEALLEPRRLRDEGFFDHEVIRRCWDEHLAGRHKWHEQLWGVLMFQNWHEYWMSEPADGRTQ